MYSNQLPSTVSLRVFESAARHLSCSAAADELGLSQSAVSKQLKGLEHSVGAPLFQRASHGLRLTSAGQHYLHTACGVLQQLEAANQRLTGGRRAPLRVRLLPSLGERWLVPRLASLRRALPQRDIVFCAGAGEETHAEFRFGDGQWPGQEVTYLFGRKLVVVCSPQLLAPQAARTPADVLSKHLLVHTHAPGHWDELAQACQLDALPRGQGRSVWGFYSLVIQAAVAGIGVAIVPRELVADEIATGLLTQPLGLGCHSRLGYYFVHRRPRGEWADLSTMSRWLLSQCNA